METIKLAVNKKIYKKVMWLLSQFNPKDLIIIDEKDDAHTAYLKKQLDEIDSGKAEFISIDQLDDLLEQSIKRHENKSA